MPFQIINVLVIDFCCCCFGMGFSEESILRMLFSTPAPFYIIRNHFIRNQLLWKNGSWDAVLSILQDFGHKVTFVYSTSPNDDAINQGIVLLIRFLKF